MQLVIRAMQFNASVFHMFPLRRFISHLEEMAGYMAGMKPLKCFDLISFTDNYNYARS